MVTLSGFFVGGTGMGRLTRSLALALMLLMLLRITSEAQENWVGYVCKVMDFYECKNGKKMIFPRPDRYSDKETCYEEFEKIYVLDKQMNKLYPQTNDPAISYIYGCVREK